MHVLTGRYSYDNAFPPEELSTVQYIGMSFPMCHPSTEYEVRWRSPRQVNILFLLK